MIYSLEKVVPPFERPEFREMNKKEAQKYFEWYMSALPDRLNILIDYFVKTGGGNEAELDYTPESLIKLWKWFIPHVEVVEKSPDELDKELKDAPDLLKDKISTNTHKLSVITLAIAMDIAQYYGELFVKNFEKVEWGFITKPKTHTNVNKPVLLGFKAGKYETQMDVMGILYVLATKVSEENSSSELLYDNYKFWSERVKLS